MGVYNSLQGVMMWECYREYYNNGAKRSDYMVNDRQTMWSLLYYENGKIKRDTNYNRNPAVIEYDESGNRIHEVYYFEGKIHRDNGPAKIWYSESGEIKSKEYYINGTLIQK